MRIYTKTEIEADIRDLEGVDVGVPDVQYLRRYSDYYNDVPIDNEKTVADLKVKLDDYIQAVGISSVDIDLTQMDTPTVFGCNTDTPNDLHYLMSFSSGGGEYEIMQVYEAAIKRGFSMVSLIIPETGWRNTYEHQLQ